MSADRTVEMASSPRRRKACRNGFTGVVISGPRVTARLLLIPRSTDRRETYSTRSNPRPPPPG